jgi:photosystem II stability/assembly factor-like uncharacterized protein
VFTAPSGVPVGNLAVDPSNPSIVYVAYNFGQVLKTTNGGATWTTLTAGPGFSATAAVAVDPTLTSVVWAGDAVGHMFRSTDGGTSWGEETTAPALTRISRMVFDGGTFMSRRRSAFRQLRLRECRNRQDVRPRHGVSLIKNSRQYLAVRGLAR